MLSRLRRFTRVCCALICIAGWFALWQPRLSDGATVSWNNAVGGNWSGLNWTGGVGANPPQSGDTAAFNLAATYNVALDVSPSISSTTIGGSNVSFSNSTVGRTYTNALGMSVNSGSFNLTAATPINWVNNN